MANSSGVARAMFHVCAYRAAMRSPTRSPAGPDDERRMRLLHRLGLVVRLAHLVVRALDGGAPLGPQRDQDAAGLLEPAHALAEGR